MHCLRRDRQLAAAVSNLATGVTITTPAQPENALTFVNQAFTTMTGYSSDELIGRNCRFLQGPATDPETVAEIRKIIAEQRIGTVELVNYRKDGMPFWNELTISPVYDRNGNLMNFVGLQTDITERKKTQAALIQQKQRLRSLYEVATLTISDPAAQFKALLAVGIDLLDLELGIIGQIEGNDYIILHFYPPNSLWKEGQTFALGQTYCDITYNAQSVTAINNIQESEYVDHPYHQEFTLAAYIGVPIWVNKICFGILNFSSTKPRQETFNQADKDFIRLMSELVSTTLERIKDRDALARARDEALEASHFKSLLLAKVSHELRTPLGAILGYTELLHEEILASITHTQAMYLQRVLNSTDYLTELVNDLLDQAQLDAGELVLDVKPFSPQELLQEMEIKTRVLAEDKGLTLTIKLDPNLPPILHGDTKRLQQILINLVSNAIKFTEAGSVQTRLYSPDPNCWAIEVVDTGQGISPKAQVVIFEPFRQVDDSLAADRTGTGLGLSIVKQFVTLMDGEILLSSEVGQGSTFTVILPILGILE